MMKAVRIHGHGGPSALRHEEAEKPEAGPGQILIRVAVAGVNPADHKHRSGMFRDFVAYRFPQIPGYDVAGTVEALGEGVSAPPPGTRVFAMLDPLAAGGYAEYAVADASMVAVMPQGMDFATAAGMACPALTGAQMIEEGLKPAPGDLILITGATGMVGRFALKAAKAAGARVVAAVRTSYAEEARQLGADEVVPLDGSAWRGAPFGGVIDTVGGAAATALAAAVGPGGRILTAATDPLDETRLPVAPEFVAVRPDGARLAQLGQAVMAGAVSVTVAARYPLAQAAEAQQAVEQGGLRGKVVLIVDPDALP